MCLIRQVDLKKEHAVAILRVVCDQSIENMMNIEGYRSAWSQGTATGRRLPEPPSTRDGADASAAAAAGSSSAGGGGGGGAADANAAAPARQRGPSKHASKRRRR